MATARVTLSLPGNDSLKGKRKVVRRILDRARHRLNAAIAEVDAMDDHRRIVLGAAVVSNDARHANAMIDGVQELIATATEAVVIDRQMELLHVGEMDDWG
ncbi:MAG: DUF503 domain-containing protein [Sandaracinaceae bacterium]|nr:DUF503 domain-containing protein [Sandaracinaceae bacterium]